jgi:hypothetical protein
MSKSSHGARARQVTGILALCAAAAPALADPVSLTATCHLRSLLPGDGQCDLSYQLTDDFASPSEARAGQIRVDNKLVAQFVNDAANPVPYAVALVSGSVTVTCGANHSLGARIAPLGDGSAYVTVSQLPVIRCPAAQ